MIQEHEIVLYQVEGTNICVNVVFKDETFWMTQKAMAELFDVNVPAISKHLSNIFEEGELFKEATVSKMEIVMSYSRISPRLAISLLILIFLLIPFRQSCRIGYNVRDLLSKNIGVLRCNHRTACFSFSCCSSHATRIF